jgi:hypothetical protein
MLLSIAMKINSSKDVKSKVIDSMTLFLALGTWFMVVCLHLSLQFKTHVRFSIGEGSAFLDPFKN